MNYHDLFISQNTQEVLRMLDKILTSTSSTSMSVIVTVSKIYPLIVWCGWKLWKRPASRPWVEIVFCKNCDEIYITWWFWSMVTLFFFASFVLFLFIGFFFNFFSQSAVPVSNLPKDVQTTMTGLLWYWRKMWWFLGKFWSCTDHLCGVNLWMSIRDGHPDNYIFGKTH